MFRRVFVLIFLVGAAVQFACADSPKITAVLTSSEVVVGETVRLEIQIDNARASAITPREIEVPGLQIHYTGESTQMTMRNFSVSSSITYSYTILPEKSGTYKIPPQTIRVGKDNLQTPELTLRVADSSRATAGKRGNRAPSGSAPAGSGQNAEEKIAFAELLVPKKTAYVGEIIPVVLRIGFNSRTQLREMAVPQINGQGFTVQKLSEGEKNLETIDGQSYVVFTYKTAISAARPGDFQIGPVEEKANVLVARRSSGAPRRPFDPFSGEDPFSDPFFMPFGGLMEQHEISIKSDPVPLEVKSLPSGAPANFSGAIGSFSMTAEANPKRVQVGDPITIKAAIAGRGNFDRMNAPELSDERGWHKYPPSSNFKQDDDVGISGTKSFELVVSPNEKLTTIAPLVFSYFDPAKDRYITLQSEAMPITVEGNAQATPAAGAATGAAVAPNLAGPQKPQDILHQINERGKIVHTFAPLYARAGFWLAQLFPLALALGLLGWKVQSIRASNRAALRAAQLQHEKDELLRKLRRKQLAPRDYFSDASRVVQLKTALKENNIEPATVDAETAARVFGLDPEQSERMRRLFAKNDELRYSGVGGDGALTSDGRREALELIESLP
ncbi:MAG: BatD family protein [Chthoniobacterales bacterium]